MGHLHCDLFTVYLCFLFSLLTSLETNASADCRESEVTEDLDVTNLQLLLVVFHRLSTASQSDLLSLCVGSLIRVSAVVRYYMKRYLIRDFPSKLK